MRALIYPQQVESEESEESEDLQSWACAWCGGAAEDEESLLDHQEWCLGDARSNSRLIAEVGLRDGELTQEALVAEAQKRRNKA